ncbi:MAG: hypothetical protein R3337_00045 [Gammaproteobacteria bacterium]|nr:hypothetical protein [Gammaproteobacteria bacterium]
MALIGTFSIGAIIPVLLEGQLAVGATATQLQARLEGLYALQVRLGIQPPSISADAAAVAELAAAFEVALPGVDIQTNAVAAAILQLEATLGPINAFLAIAGILGVAGVHVYRVDGTAAQMRAELSGDLAPGFPGADGVPNATGTGFLLVANSGAAREALTAIITVG